MAIYPITRLFLYTYFVIIATGLTNGSISTKLAGHISTGTDFTASGNNVFVKNSRVEAVVPKSVEFIKGPHRVSQKNAPVSHKKCLKVVCFTALYLNKLGSFLDKWDVFIGQQNFLLVYPMSKFNNISTKVTFKFVFGTPDTAMGIVS